MAVEKSVQPKLHVSFIQSVAFQTTYHVLLRIIYLATLITQMAIINYYLVTYNDGSLLWALWAIPDVIIIGLFITTATLSYLEQKKIVELRKSVRYERCFGVLSFVYITWFLYAVLLATKVCIIYKMPDGIAFDLKESFFFGPNMLKTSISLSTIIFYVLVLSCHDAPSHSTAYAFINCIVGSVYIDLLDTTQFLGILLVDPDQDQMLSRHIHHIVLAVVSFNFLVPTEVLFILSRTQYGKFPYSKKFQFFHKMILMLLLNVPFFVLRMTAWHLHDHNVSVFLIKNLLGIGMAVKDIHDFIIEVDEVYNISEKKHVGMLAVIEGDKLVEITADREKGDHVGVDDVEFKSVDDEETSLKHSRT